MFVLSWLFLIAVRLVLIALGLVVTPVALLFETSSSSVSDGRPILVLPDWAWLWSNDFDGSLGDKRGWWDAHAPFGLGAHHFLSKFIWLAVRNPVNNLRRTDWFSCPVKDCYIDHLGSAVVEDKPGKGGWQLVEAEHQITEERWYGFYWVHEWNERRALVVRLGFKIKPEHADKEEPPKGFTVRLNPWKEL